MLPKTPHLQAAVLIELNKQPLTTSQLQHALAKKHIPSAGPAFYQLMTRLEQAKFVKTRRAKERDKENLYLITPNGAKALKQVLDFYKSF